MDSFIRYTIVSLSTTPANSVYWNRTSVNLTITFNAISNGFLIQKPYIIIIIVTPILYNIKFDNIIVINGYILGYNIISFEIAK